MAVWLQVKIRGGGLSLRPIGCTPALSVTQKRRCSCSCGLWCYINVICVCNFGDRAAEPGVWNYLPTDLGQLGCHTAISDSRWGHFIWSVGPKHSVNPSLNCAYLLTYVVLTLVEYAMRQIATDCCSATFRSCVISVVGSHYLHASAQQAPVNVQLRPWSAEIRRSTGQLDWRIVAVARWNLPTKTLLRAICVDTWNIFILIGDYYDCFVCTVILERFYTGICNVIKMCIKSHHHIM